MADQETRAEGGAASTDTSADAPTSTVEDTTDADTSSEQTAAESSGGSSETAASSGTGTTDSGASDSAKTDGTKTDGETSGDGPTPARRSENHAKPQQLSDSDRDAQEANRRSFVEGREAGTDEKEPEGASRRRSVDVGELVWNTANVLATVIRIVTLLFAVVLVAHIALVVVGVNPVNGVASFLAGFSDAVVLGFRDLFQPADPTIALVVNYGVAAVFWVVVGGFVSAGIRFLAARVS